MKENFMASAERGISYLKKYGAFLTVKCGDIINTMTIGWGSIGYMWRIPVFTVLVRKSRYTHELIEKSSEFTVSIPFEGSLKHELIMCGTKSGRGIDKIKECNLMLSPAKSVSTPVIDGCSLYYECKIVYRHDLDASKLDKGIIKDCYGDNCYHTIYYGRITDIYTK